MANGMCSIGGDIVDQFPPGNPGVPALIYWDTITKRYIDIGIGAGLSVSGGQLIASGSSGPVSLANAGWGIANTRTNIATTGTINNQPVASTFLNYIGASAVTITGLVAQLDGTEIVIYNETGVTLTLKNQNTSSAVANRIITPSATDYIVPTGSSVRFRYDGNQSCWLALGGALVNGSGGALQFANNGGTALDNDSGNFIYNKSLSRLQISNIYCFNELDVGSKLRFLNQADNGIPFFISEAGVQGFVHSDPTNFNYDSINKSFNVGNAGGAYSFNAFGKLDIIPPPISFSAQLISAGTAVAPNGQIANIVYGPLAPSSGSGVQNTNQSGYIATGGGQTYNYNILAYDTISGVPNTGAADSFGVTDAIPFPLNNGSDNLSIENPAYSGYNNNDTVSAVVWPYRVVNGIYYTSTSSFALPTITLLANPSGIDWNWNAATNTDSSTPDGYIIEITDQTTSTTYQYNVGAALTYADMNSGGSFAYTNTGIPYGIDLSWGGTTNGDNTAVSGYIVQNATTGNSYDAGNSLSYNDENISGSVTYISFVGITSSGQTINWTPYVAALSPSGNVYYVAGTPYSFTDTWNNGSLFQLTHSIYNIVSPNWRIIEDISGNGTDGTGASSFVETSYFTGANTVSPSTYGILSDGVTLTRDFQAYSYNGTLYSPTFLTASTVDNNDGQYYYIALTASYGSSQMKLLQQINGGGFTSGQFESASSFGIDALGPAFSDTTVVTPNVTANPAGYFESQSVSNTLPTVIINADVSSGYPMIQFQSNGSPVGNLSVSNNANWKLQASQSGTGLTLLTTEFLNVTVNGIGYKLALIN